MKIKLKSTLYFDFCFVSMFIWSRNSHLNKTSTQTFHKITYTTITLARRTKKLLVLAFLDYILSFAKARDKIKSKKTWTFSIKRTYLSKNFITLWTKITVLLIVILLALPPSYLNPISLSSLKESPFNINYK